MTGRRSVIVYLVILLALGGYFYYFEVVGKERKEVEERQARKVFHIDSNQVQAFEVFPSGKAGVKLENQEGWKIVDPIRSDVDGGSVTTFLETLEGLESERKVADGSDNLEAFGLKEPPLKVRFRIGEQWNELDVGSKNPGGNMYYAMKADTPGVFLLSASNWGLLNKGVNDLRRRELFAFRPEEVVGLQVVWQDGSSLAIEQKEGEGESGGGGWTAPGYSDLAIKQGKVENLFEQVGWLRAGDFLENGIKNLETYGLESPVAVVTLRLKSGQKAELRIGKVMDEKKDQLAAYSTELPAVVQVDGKILRSIPKNVHDFEDRSLTAFKLDGVRRIKWQLGVNQGHVVRMDGDEWAWKGPNDERQPVKEPWRVKSVIWGVQDSEYERKIMSSPGPPDTPYARLEFWADERLGSLIWQKPEADDPNGAKPVTAWIEEKGATQAVEVKPGVMEKIESKLSELSENK